MKVDFNETTNHDTVCVGFGPAGIALACGVSDAEESGYKSPMGDCIFLEDASRTAWHPEFILPGTDINHHMFRDVVTPRNPRSRFSFAMYLKEKGRIYSFGLLGRPASRREWSDYLTWVAGQLHGLVSYGERAVEILPGVQNGRLTHFNIGTSKGMRRARRIVLSTGSVPYVPDWAAELAGPTVFHTSQYLSRVEAFGCDLPKRWLIVGSGQSASEGIANLLGRRRDVEITSLHRTSGFHLAQFGQFPNQAFSPERVDYFHSLDAVGRERLFREMKATNYAGIDADESAALFSLMYEDEIEGRHRLSMLPFSEIVSVRKMNDGFEVTYIDIYRGCEQSLKVDAILLGTGYRQPKIPPLLSAIQPWLSQAPDGGIAVGRDYRVALDDPADARIYVNGLSERSHGISDAQSFSLLAMRAERILESFQSELAAAAA
jgi:L-ornithine N5-oxygenase